MANAPFGDCKTARLHLTAYIQPSGALLAIDRRTRRICACSANILQFTGKTPDDLLGQCWTVLFAPEPVARAFDPFEARSSELAHIQQAELNGKPVVIACHSVGSTALVEIEPVQTEAFQFNSAEVVAYLSSLGATVEVEDAAELLMNTVASITQFDRVMLYKFLPGWHGEVIAEVLRPGVEGFLGLRFPVTDLPGNARRLYLLNWKRAIDDVHAAAVPILSTPDCGPLDLTFSQLRAVHPVHVQYLKNIGTESAFSISIVLAGHLWGLIACHHLTAKKISLKRKTLCEQLSRMASIHMADLSAMHVEKAHAAYREAQAEVKGALRASERAVRAISTQLDHLHQMFKSQGVWAQLDGQNYYSGEMPDEMSLGALKSWIATREAFCVTACSAIPPELAQYPALVRYASGILYIPLTAPDFLVLMRPEQVETVIWAGKPQSLSGNGDAHAELTPRASFHKWSQLVQGASAPWQEVDIDAAARLRELLIEHIEEIRLEGFALHDQLTGLANRYMFERKLSEAIKLSIQGGSISAVYMLDLDKFKPVNDTMGHAAGDELLVRVSERLKEVVRERDVVARLGGDEFAIIQFHLSEPKYAEITAERILSEIRRPFTILGQGVEIGVSIGIAICPFHATEERELVQNADLALYQAKHAGRNMFKVFTGNMLSDKEQKDSVRIALVNAMERDEVSFVYQPIVSAQTRAVRAFEAFARWQHPEKGPLRAAAFIPLIEQHQLSIRFAEWTIRRVVRQGREWADKGLPLKPVSLNMSASQFLSLDVAGLCASLASEYDVNLGWLSFDVDEGALRTDFERGAEKIAALARLGVLTNIDHFGNGAVPLRRLVGLHVNQLKVPGKLFVEETAETEGGGLAAIINSIGNVIYAHVVATRIETAAMEKRATASGIELLQGYAISHGLSPDEVEKVLRTGVL